MNAYHTGKMGMAEGIALVFGLIVPRLFLSQLADALQINGQLLWLSMLIYTMIPLVMFFMMVYANNSVSGDIVKVCQQLVGKIGAWIIVVTYIGMFLCNGAILLRQYAEYTLITALHRVDFQIVIIWYAITIGIVCYLGIEALCRTGYIMLPLLLGGLIVVFVAVSPFYVIYNLTPWQGNGIMTVINSGIHSGGLNFGVLSLIFLSSAFQNSKTIKRIAIYSLGGTAILRIIFALVYTMVFGVSVGAEKVMPYFEMARLVYINQYIQRIESLFILVWVILGLLSIAGSLYIALYLIVILLKLPTMRPLVPLGVIFIAHVAMLPPDIGYTIYLDQLLMQVAQIGIYLFPGILFVMALVKRRKKPCADS
ncbi:GerAB/ArcD/ProY family transporter [Pelosinus sp. sgz500959]|uniref:GerAB/ArcD/ProY family transporter n=1 Tax=Pelosinus sp. sgz500959 TaxID=3242472 RepID=UPI00366C5AB3